MNEPPTTATRTDELLDALDDADAACDRVDGRIAEYGEDTVERVADAHDRATDLLARYESTATGTGRENFKKFMEFKSKFSSLVEDLSDDLPERGAFEAAKEDIDKNRLSEDDFERAREALGPARDVAGLLDDRRDARARYREVRRETESAISDLRDEIADHERLLELGDADLDAPVEEIRRPIERYDEAVEEAFAEFTSEASARAVLAFVDATRDYALVSYRTPPETLREYVEGEAGTETIADLLKYADYSNSKLDHYVDDPTALKRAVATNRTYLERLDAGPLRIEWPPKSAAELRWRVGELVSVVARFADEDVVAALREVQSVVRDEERFERLRTAAEARTELSDAEREKIESGAVWDELAALRERKAELEDALDEYPER